MTFCACLVQSGLNNVFHRYAQSCIFIKCISADTEAFTQLTIKNKKESSAESFKSVSVTGISHEWMNE